MEQVLPPVDKNEIAKIADERRRPCEEESLIEEDLRRTKEESAHIIERMNKLFIPMVARQKRLEAFMARQPQSIRCEKHGMELPINLQKTQELCGPLPDEEWRPGYRACHHCERGEAWLTRHGVPGDLLHCRLDNWEPPVSGAVDLVKKCYDFVKHGRGFFILRGNIGAGKSHLAVGMMAEFNRGRFVTHSQFICLLRAGYSNPRAVNPIDRYGKASLLIFDELGLSTGGKDELPAMHEMFTYRYQHKLPTVITCNCSGKEFEGYIGERMHSRLRHALFCEANLDFVDFRKKMGGSY